VATPLQGLGVSSGVADGRVVLLPATSLPVVPVPVPPERVDEEIVLFEEVRERARKELEDIRNRTFEQLGQSYAGILDAQILILVDPRLVSETTQRIRVGRVSASWALKEVVGEFTRKFESIDDPYLRERVGDLEDVHLRLQRLLRGEHSPRDEMPGEGPWVVVAHSLGPSDSVLLARHSIAGFATDVGGRTSHTAILAQALSVPAVVGLHDISQRVRSGDPIILDGDTGEVVLEPGPEEREQAQTRIKDLAATEDTLVDAADLPVVTVDGVEVTVQANIEFPQEVDKAVSFGAGGIGLYRSEFLFLARSPDFPSEDEHYATYSEMARKMTPHQVTIRTLDLGGEKYYHEVLDRQESNPVLGLRAIRFCLKRPDIFRPQLRGLLRAAAESDIRVMIPLVTTVTEVREVRRLLAEEAESLAAAGVPCRSDIPVGIMIEVPAAAIAADLLARECDFFAIGTNDLIQYSLAVDRGNESVNYLYQPLHPALLRMLRFIVESANRQGIPVSLCGEMAADTALTGLLLGLGVRQFSVQPRAVAPVIRAVREVDVPIEAERVAQAMDLSTSAEVEELLRKGGRPAGAVPGRTEPER
jgi:phosphotransferase system enzyme I (PtsI)